MLIMPFQPTKGLNEKHTQISSDLAGGWEQDHRLIQVGKDLRRSLVQPPVHRRVSCQARPGCSGFHLVKVENLQGHRLHNISRHPVPPPDCPHRVNFFLISSMNLSCFSLFSLSLIFPPCTTSLSPGPSPSWPPYRHWGLPLGLPEAVCFRLNKPSSPSLSSQGRCSRWVGTSHGLLAPLLFIQLSILLANNQILVNKPSSRCYLQDTTIFIAHSKQ